MNILSKNDLFTQRNVINSTGGERQNIYKLQPSIFLGFVHSMT